MIGYILHSFDTYGMAIYSHHLPTQISQFVFKIFANIFLEPSAKLLFKTLADLSKNILRQLASTCLFRTYQLATDFSSYFLVLLDFSGFY